MTETKPKRRWFRFSLRTLLVLLTLACVLLSVFAIWHRSQLIEHHRQQDAADRIIAKKGHVSWMSWVRRAGEQNGKVPESLMRAADQSNAFLRLCGVDLRNSPDADGVAIATEVADLSQLDAFTFPVKWLDDPIFLEQLDRIKHVDQVCVEFPFPNDVPMFKSLDEADSFDRQLQAKAEARLGLKQANTE